MVGNRAFQHFLKFTVVSQISILEIIRIKYALQIILNHNQKIYESNKIF